MALKLRVMTEAEVAAREAAVPDWYREDQARLADHHAKHPHCIGCGQFVKKRANICADCDEPLGYGY